MKYGFQRKRHAMQWRAISMACASGLIALAAVLLPLRHVSAQESMSGGGYTLNGGVTVFSSDMSGGGYTLGISGDPATGMSSGGDYSFMPTPYASDSVTPPPAPAPAESGSGTVSSGGGVTGGYTYYPQPGFATGTEYVPSESDGITGAATDVDRSRPVFNPANPSTGLQWIDDGKGVDVDFDGKPDIYANRSPAQGSAGTSTQQHPVQSPLIKTYANDLMPMQIAVTVLFLICSLIAPVIRRKEISGMPNAVHPYRISRLPLAIFIDYLIIMHRMNGSEIMPHPEYRSERFERGGTMSTGGHSGSKVHACILLDAIIVPALLMMCIAWSWPISSVLSMAFIAVFAVRLFIGRRILD